MRRPPLAPHQAGARGSTPTAAGWERSSAASATSFSATQQQQNNNNTNSNNNTANGKSDLNHLRDGSPYVAPSAGAKNNSFRSVSDAHQQSSISVSRPPPPPPAPTVPTKGPLAAIQQDVEARKRMQTSLTQRGIGDDSQPLPLDPLRSGTFLMMGGGVGGGGGGVEGADVLEEPLLGRGAAAASGGGGGAAAVGGGGGVADGGDEPIPAGGALDTLAVKNYLAGTAFDLDRHRLKKKGLMAQNTAGVGAEHLLRIGGTYEDPVFDWVVKVKTQQIFTMSMAGVVTMLCMTLYTWYVNVDENEDAPTDSYYDDPFVSPTTLNIMYLCQAVLTITTVVAMVLISQKYSLKLMEKRAEWSGVTIRELERHRGEAALDANRQAFFNSSYPLLTSSLFYRCLAELLIHLLHPIVWMASYTSIPSGPMIDRTPNTLYKLMQICVLFRLYLIAEMIHVNGSAYINRFEIITAKPELLKIGFVITRFLSVKLQFFKRPVLMLIALSLCSLLVFGFVLFTSERIEGYVPANPTSMPFDPLNALWNAFEAFATLGYGELIPVTTLGRITSCLCALTGIVSFITFSAVLVQQMALSKEQKYAMEFLNCRQADIQYRAASESLIWTWIEEHLLPEVRREISRRLGALTIEEMDEATLRKRRSHKGNRIYYVTKRFRHARRTLEGAFAQANDEIIDQKLTAVKELVEAVGEEVAEHQQEMAVMEHEVQQRLKALISKMSELRRRGHVPV